MSSTRRGAPRIANDFYSTPPRAVHSLLNRVGDELGQCLNWLEPCAGDGAIIKAVNDHYATEDLEIHWDGVDIVKRPGVTELCNFHQQSFLLFSAEKTYDVVITNPAFFIAQEIVEHSLALIERCYSQPVVIMLLRLGFLGSEKRAPWWQDREPDAMYVLSERPDFTGGGGDSCDYAWFFWNWHKKGIFVLES